MRTCTVTKHAAQRACERFGLPPESAPEAIEQAWRASIPLPWHLGRVLLDCRLRHQKGVPSVRVHGSMLLLCRGRAVVTVWRLSDELCATVLAWTATGEWAGEYA